MSFKNISLMASLALLVFGAALLTAGERSAVNWRALRCVVLESDDWGLAGFVPSAEAWEGIEREGLNPGHFPVAYWNSTLEDSAVVSRLCGLLAGFRGRDGLPPVMQANYVLSSLSLENGAWQRYDLPHVPPQYARRGLWLSVEDGMRQGTWYPEFHAAWHYDPDLRKSATEASALAAAAAERGIMLFPGGETARELGPWRSTIDLAGELDHSLELFQSLFGRLPDSVIAPDYTWDGRIETLWASRGLNVIQAKREQRNPSYPGGGLGRAVKFVDRQLSRAFRPERRYLERNCRLEVVQSPDAEAHVASCLADTKAAWRRNEPAIVETHRINYVHADSVVVHAGRQGLRTFLDGLAGSPGSGPIFLTDIEVARLAKGGVSWRRGPDRAVVRNGSHSRRLVVVPARDLGPGSFSTILVLDAGRCAVSDAGGRMHLLDM